MPHTLVLTRFMQGCLLAVMFTGACLGDEPPVAWPTADQLLGRAQAGQWIKYQLAMTRGTQAIKGTLWQVYEGKQGQEHVLRTIQAPDGEASVTPPAQGKAGTQSALVKVKGDQTFMLQPLPSADKLTSDQTTRSAFTGLQVGSITYSGDLYVRELAFEMSATSKVTGVLKIWVSPQAPLTGIVKQTVTFIGPMVAHAEMTLIASEPAGQVAKAKPDEKPIEIILGSPQDMLTLSDQFAHAGWKLGPDGKPKAKARRMFSPLDAYHAKLAVAAAEMGLHEYALKVRGRLDSPRVNTWLNDNLQRVLGIAGKREELLAIGVDQGKLEETILKHKLAMRVESLPYDSNGEYLEMVRQETNPASRWMMIRTAFDTHLLPLELQKQLYALAPTDNHRQLICVSQWGWAMQEAQSPDVMDDVVALVPAMGDSPLVPIVKARILLRLKQDAQAGQQIDRAIELTRTHAQAMDASETSRKHVNESIHQLMGLLGTVNDKRFDEMDRVRMQYLFASASMAIKKQPEQIASKYVAPHLARWVAVNGDRQQAQAVLGRMKDRTPFDDVDLLVVSYIHSGKRQEAIQWYESFEGDAAEASRGMQFRMLSDKSAAALGFAKHHWRMQQAAEYEKWITLAIDQAVQANEQFIAWNKANKPHQFWRRGGFMNDEASMPPYQRIAGFLVDHATSDNQQRLLAMLGSLQDEMNVSASVRDAWRDAARQAAGHGDATLVTAIFKALPADWENNWASSIYAESAAPVSAQAEDGKWNVQVVRAMVAATPKPGWKAEVLRASIIELANRNRIDDAQALMADLKQLVAEGAWAKHQALATVALAKAYANKGQWDDAIAAFNDRSTDLDESIPVRGINGVNWANYLYDIGLAVSEWAASPDINNYQQYEIARRWVESTQDNRERAALMLGMARGYDRVQYAR